LLYKIVTLLAIFLQVDIYRCTPLQNIITLEKEQFPEKKILSCATRLEIFKTGRIKKGKYVIILVLYIVKDERCMTPQLWHDPGTICLGVAFKYMYVTNLQEE